MATIRKRNRKYQAIVRKKGHKEIVKTFLLKRDAEKWARKTESEMERGIYIDTSKAYKMSVSELLDRYEREHSIKFKSARQESRRIQAMKKAFGHYMLSSITTKVLTEYRDKAATYKKITSVRREMTTLRRALRLADSEWGIKLPHGVPSIIFPKFNDARDRRLLDGEESLLKQALRHSPTVQSIFQFALETAMRRSEIVALRWEYVDLNELILQISETKNGHSRTIPLSNKAISILKKQHRNMHEPVFDIKPDSVTQAFKRACRRAGIINLTFHDLRHEAVTRFFEKGLSIIEVASISGHKDVKMLQRYTHLKAQDLLSKINHVISK